MPPTRSSKAAYSKMLSKAKLVPRSLLGDVTTMIKESCIAHDADRAAIDAFLQSAAVVLESSSYKALKFKSQAKKHCVRCHATFSDASNSTTACVIRHAFDAESKSSITGGNYIYTSECCGPRIILKEEGAGEDYWMNLRKLGPCFQGAHTTEIKAAKKKYNNVNIKRCKPGLASGRCVTKWFNGNDPAWSWQFDSDAEAEAKLDAEWQVSDDEFKA